MGVWVKKSFGLTYYNNYFVTYFTNAPTSTQNCVIELDFVESNCILCRNATHIYVCILSSAKLQTVIHVFEQLG